MDTVFWAGYAFIDLMLIKLQSWDKMPHGWFPISCYYKPRAMSYA